MSSMRATPVGLAVGCLGALAVGVAMRATLFETGPTEWPPLVGAAAVLLCTGVLACYLPARRAAASEVASILKV
jgi:putative ABC transport system permease protein